MEAIEIDPLTEFFDAIQNPVTRTYYERRLALFFEFLKLEGNLKTQARSFAGKAKLDNAWATFQINEYMRFQKGRVEKKEIKESTVPNFYKPIKLFCVENDLMLNFTKISRRIPKGKNYADDRIPSIEEIKSLLEYSDRRLKVAVLIMLSSGCRVGSFETLKCGDIEPIEENGSLAGAKIKLYAGSNEEYTSFLTPEAYRSFKQYIDFRKLHGEKVTKDSPVLRDLFQPDKAGRGEPHLPKRFGYNATRNLVWTALRSQGLRKLLTEGKKRHEFAGDHSFRKYFKTICEHTVKSIYVEMLMGHSIGLGDSYERPNENELFKEYLKAIPELTILEARPQSASSEDIASLKQELTELRKKQEQETSQLRKDQLENMRRNEAQDRILEKLKTELRFEFSEGIGKEMKQLIREALKEEFKRRASLIP